MSFIEHFIIQMLMCVFVGGAMGAITRTKVKGAGPRTFILVTIGAALVTIVSTEFFKLAGNPWLADPGRIAAQVISALGFMGTGVIWMANEQNVRGLWTAAAIWVSAIIGMVIGLGYFGASTIGLLMITLALLGIEYYYTWRKNGYGT